MQIDKERLIALKNEILMAEVLNTNELEPILITNLRRYIGDYIPPLGSDWDIVLNELYSIIQNELPSIFFRNPRAFLKPRNKTFVAKKTDPLTGRKEEVELDSTKSAKTQEAILNYDITQIKYKEQVRKVLLDALLFPYGILWHGYKGDFGMTEELSIDVQNGRNFVRRINPLKFLKDPSVSISDIDEASWIGRSFDVPLVDIIEDNKLNASKELKGKQAFNYEYGARQVVPSEKWRGSSGGQDKVVVSSRPRFLLDYTTEEYKRSKSSRYIKVYEIFLRPTKKEFRENSRGWILLLTDEQDKPLRENKWTIKAEGWPSKILEFNQLNDNMFGLSDPEAFGNVIDQKNTIINLQLRNAQENSKVWVGISKEGANEEDITKVQSGQQTIILFESGKPQERMYVASPGGQASSELYLLDQRIQRNLDDKSGIIDLKRGVLQSGEESKFSVEQRMLGSSARPAYRQDIMSDFLKSSLLYLNQLNKQFMTVDEAVRIVGSLNIEWSDKPSKEEIQADVDVEIDVISMLPENPEKELRELNTALMLMIDGIRDPAIAQKLAQEGKTLNLSPIIEQMLMRLRIKDPEVFRNIRPEESQGFVSIQQLREARDNVNAALTGQQVPYPPKPTDDHRAKIETYASITSILQAMGQISDTLNQLIQVHQALLQQIMEKEETAGIKLALPRPKVQTVGA